MISVPEITLARVVAVGWRSDVPVASDGIGKSPSRSDEDVASPLVTLALRAARALPACDYGGVIAATFSNPERFPALAIRVAAALGLPASTPAFDLQMACSAYPYAIYLAGHLAADTGKPVLVLDGDVQTPLVDPNDHATGHIFSDAMTATVVTSSRTVRALANSATAPIPVSPFGFLSRADDALTCAAAGPIRMDGFKVFSFVATEVSAFLRAFGTDFDCFVPHQANPYMIRQLARSLGLADKLLTLPDDGLNPGSSSIPLTLAQNAVAVSRTVGVSPTQPIGKRVLLAGFGAGYSAAAGIVRLAPDFTGVVL